mgnify:CR=1 FL=1
MEAVQKGSKDTVRLLLDHGADVNAADINEWTPLMEAVQKGSKEIVQLLLDRGADVNVADSWGNTPLMKAAQKDIKETVPLLLDHGADVNVANHSGLTPLFFYAGHGIQAQGQNYLVPLGVDLKREAHLKIYAVEANWVLAQMEAADNAMNLVVLDACRDNPFTRSWKRGTSRGLVRMEAPRPWPTSAWSPRSTTPAVWTWT